MTNIIQAETHFNPAARSKNLCVSFDNVVKTFHPDRNKRVAGLLSADIYDAPCFTGDTVLGGLYYEDFIVTAPDYYLYRREPGLLRSFAPAIGEYVGTGATIYDLGPGPDPSIEGKTKTILAAVEPYHVYKPIDNAPAFVRLAEASVLKTYPDLPVKGEVLNFQQDELPPAENDKSLILYLGSTISNAPSKPGWTFMSNPYYQQYLSLLRRSAAKEGYMAITHDCNQNKKSLIASYSHPTTAKFFENVTHKIKRDLMSPDMEPDAFRYRPVWNKRADCVEHTLTATHNQNFRAFDPFSNRTAQILIYKGEDYITVNSYKPSVGQMQQRLLRAGWMSAMHRVDEQTGYLATHLCRSVALER